MLPLAPAEDPLLASRRLLTRAQSLRVTVAALPTDIPPPITVPDPEGGKPSRMVSPETVLVPARKLKTLILALPLIANTPAPGPLMVIEPTVRFPTKRLPRFRSSRMLPVTFPAKLIVFAPVPVFAAEIASRRVQSIMPQTPS